MFKINKNTVSLIFILIIGLTLNQCSNKNSDQTAQSLPELTVGIQVSPAMTLVMVAEDLGFFDSAGVDVKIKEFTAGKFALQAFLGGSLDIAISGEVPVALSSLSGNKFKVITQVVERTINECRVVVLKDSLSSTPEEYFNSKKRKLATSFGGGPEFFTYNFLKKHGISNSQVEIISQKPEDMPASLNNGSVDAISIFDPFARIAEIQLGDRSVTFADPDIYSELYVADVMEKTINEKPELLKAFIKGLYDAHFYIEKYPEESKKVLIKYTNLDKNIIDDIWNNFVFKPALNELFVEYTTAEAKWSIEKGDYPEGTQIPNFESILYPNFLLEIDSSLVSIK